MDWLKKQLKTNKNIKCNNYKPLYISKKHKPVSPDQIRKLTKNEVEKYLDERKKMGIE